MKKTIFITGASSGIGKTTALYFANRGWNVAASMRSPENELELKNSDSIKLYELDVTNQEQIESVLKQVIIDFSRLDVLLNNAGFGAVGVFEKSSDAEVRKQFDVNVFGVMNITRAILPYFRGNRAGTIINITSVGGRITFPLYSVYHASKWAIEGFAESLQYEVKEFNIKIKSIEPGAIKTDFYDRSQNLFKNKDIKEYDNFENAMLDYMQNAGKNAPGPEVVAKTIFDAATDSNFKLRYPSGNQALFTLFFRSLLPSRWFNTGIQKFAERIVKKS